MEQAAARKIVERFAGLGPEQRKRFWQKLLEQGVSPWSLPILPRASDAVRARLSYAQQRMWFLWKLEPDSIAYHIPIAQRLRGDLDTVALRLAFEDVAARHETLRTRFEADDDGEPRQIIEAAPALSYRDWDVPPGDGADAAIQSFAQALLREPFDLEHGPVWRIGLARRSAQDHVLLIVTHHIASDGWSEQVLLRDVVAAYRRRIGTTADVPPPLPLQYPDYASWQRLWLDAGERERQLAWWTQYLGVEHPALALPVERQSGHGATALPRAAASWRQTLAVSLSERLRGLARASGTTLFMVLQAALQVLLYRVTNQGDIRIGVPNANRSRPETADLIGFFINTQVLRGQLSGQMSLNSVLAAVREAVVGAQAHQDLPFDVLVQALQPKRVLGQTPLFQVMHNHQRQDAHTATGPQGLAMESYALAGRPAQFDLSLETLEEGDGGLTVGLLYAEDLFDPATIARLGRQYLSVLHAMADRPRECVGELNLLDDNEQAALHARSGAPRHYGWQEPMHVRIGMQAAQTPQAIAVVDGDRSVSYGELDAWSNGLAHHLVGQGVGPDVRVGVALERSVELVVALLAVLKAGGAYVPLDPAYPAERLSYMMEDSGMVLLLSNAAVLKGLPQSLPKCAGQGAAQNITQDVAQDITAAGRVAQTLRTVDLHALDLSAQPTHAPAVRLHPENLAYVIYTSGSTGRPKGAANRHGGLLNRLAWMQQAYGLAATDTVLQKTPFSFDVSVWEFFWPLMTGARLAVAPPGAHRDPGELARLVQRYAVTTLHFVPSMLQAFVEEAGVQDCTTIRRVVCSGEALPPGLANRLLSVLPQAQLYNLYGPTEAAIDVTHWTCRPGAGTVPIGQPIGNVRTYVLDAELGLAAPGVAGVARVAGAPGVAGVAGELYLGGAGLARGYIGKPSLTAERFVPDPYGERGERLYRTGDLARWDGQGQLEYLGRMDHQVKIRGLRIELGEVEAQLLAQAGVREAVVTACDGPGGLRLVAYVTARPGHELQVQALREQLGTRLPDYMVPAVVVLLAEMPLNANGKTDRKALPAPELAADTYEAPQGEIEEALAAIWQDVLGVPRVGRHDNFFELGGHSLLLMRAHRRIESQFSVNLSLAMAFSSGTLQGYAQALSGHLTQAVAERRNVAANLNLLLKSLK